MKIIFLALAFTAMLTMAKQVSAAFDSADSLLTRCEKTPRQGTTLREARDYGDCFGYVTSVVDTHDLYVEWGHMSKYFCIQDASIGQLVKVFVKYANNHPEKLHLGAAGVVSNAFRSAFPCSHGW